MKKYAIPDKAMAAIKSIYDRHAADQLNFGDGKGREMMIAVPFWAVEDIAKAMPRYNGKDPHASDPGSWP